MGTKIKFKVFKDNKIKYVIRNIEHPSFVSDDDFIFNGRTYKGASVEDKVIDWLDSIDKHDFMVENHIDMIIDYQIHRQKSKKIDKLSQFKLLLNSLNIDSELMVNIIGVYTKFYCDIKRKAISEQLKFCLNCVEVGYIAQAQVLKQINSRVAWYEDKTICDGDNKILID